MTTVFSSFGSNVVPCEGYMNCVVVVSLVVVTVAVVTGVIVEVTTWTPEHRSSVTAPVPDATGAF